MVWLGGAAMAATPKEALQTAYVKVQAVIDQQDSDNAATSADLVDFWKAVDGVLVAEGPGALAESNTVELKTLPLSDGSRLFAVNLEQLGHLVLIDHGAVRWSSIELCQFPRACFIADFGLLPVATDGALRFYIDGEYAQMAGATRGRQLSFWRWKDGAMETFHRTDYAIAAEAPDGATVTGDQATIASKGSWLHFSVCGACNGRQMQHRLRVTPSGVEDLGTVSLRPELDVVDNLLGRLANDQPTADIATPETAALLKKSWHGNLFAMDPVVADHMACIAPDDNPALTFRFAPGAKAMKIIAIEPGKCS